MKPFGEILFALLLVFSFSPAGGSSAPEYISGDKLTVPDDYRQWVFLTSSLDLNYNTATPRRPDQMHMLDNVFVNPEAYASLPENRRLARQDRVAVVKENRIAWEIRPAPSAKAAGFSPG